MLSTRYLSVSFGVMLVASVLLQGCATKPAQQQDAGVEVDSAPETVTVEVTDQQKEGTEQLEESAEPAAPTAPAETVEQRLERLKQQRIEAFTLNVSSDQAKQAKEAQPEFERALTEMRKGNLDSALERMKSVSANYPALGGPIVNQAIILRKMGKTQEAYDLLHNTLINHGKNPFLLNELGVISRELGKFKQAQASYESAIRIDPNFPSAHYNLAVLADLYLHDPVQALAEFQASKIIFKWPSALSGLLEQIFF